MAPLVLTEPITSHGSQPRRVSTRRLVLSFASALLATAAAFVFVAYRSDMSDARASAAAGGSMLRTRCGDVEYADDGSGSPVLSIHGTGGGWDQGMFIARGLLDRGFRVVAPSRFGYLRTGMPPDPSPQKEADLFACILDELGLDRVAVIGASAGATPALQFALRHPERVSSLVLLVPAVGGIMAPDTVGTVPRFIMDHVLRSDFLFWSAMKAWPRLTLSIVAVPQSLVPTLSPDARADLDRATSGILPVSQRRMGILYDSRNQQTVEPYAIDRISAPTLIVSAKDDLFKTLDNARVAAARIPGAQLVTYATGGHLLLGRDDELWPMVADFLVRAGGGYSAGASVSSLH